jgi:hypothetical protein
VAITRPTNLGAAVALPSAEGIKAGAVWRKMEVVPLTGLAVSDSWAGSAAASRCSHGPVELQ